MADNVDITPGSGDTVAADDIAGVKFQRIKLTQGADGVNDGDVSSSNPLAVVESSTNQAQDAVYSAGQLKVIGGVRRDADTTPVSADGDVHPLVFDEEGRLKVATQPGSYGATTGTITGNGQTVSIATARFSNLMIYVTGTFASVTCVFEGSLDGTNWFSVQAIRTNSNTVETTTGTLSATPTYAWELSVNGLSNFRVRSTAHTSGTQNWRFLPGAYATEPIPAAQNPGTLTVSGTVTSNLGTGGVASASIGKAEDATHTSGDTGVAIWGVRNDNLATTPASATGDYTFVSLDPQSALYVAQRSHATATLANVAASATSVTLQASNVARRGLIIFNDSTVNLYVKFGSAASTTSFTYKLPAGYTLELPEPLYNGIVTGIWDSATGNARMTEIT